jgi:hypothetical protein
VDIPHQIRILLLIHSELFILEAACRGNEVLFRSAAKKPREKPFRFLILPPSKKLNLK